MRPRWSSPVAAALMLAAVSATPAVGAKPSPGSECLQTSRGTVYSSITNDRYRCVVEGNRLLLIDMGRRMTAPEGTYRNLPDGKECLVGKGGYILACSRR